MLFLLRVAQPARAWRWRGISARPPHPPPPVERLALRQHAMARTPRLAAVRARLTARVYLRLNAGPRRLRIVYT